MKNNKNTIKNPSLNARKLFKYILSDIKDKDQLANLYNTIEIEPINEYKKLIIEQWKKEVGSKDEFNKFILSEFSEAMER